MAKITRFYPGLGYGGQLAGSFAGKTQSITPAPVITMFWPGLGYGGLRYKAGAFAGKTSTMGSTGRFLTLLGAGT